MTERHRHGSTAADDSADSPIVQFVELVLRLAVRALRAAAAAGASVKFHRLLAGSARRAAAVVQDVYPRSGLPPGSRGRTTSN